MIDIKIIDSNGRKVTKTKLDTYEHMCICFLNHWGITKDIKINLYINFPKNSFKDPNSVFYKLYHLKNSGGATYYDGKEFHVYVNRTFLKKNTNSDEEFTDQISEVIAHELIHVKQYYFKEKEHVEGRSLFNGEDITDLPYDDQPHEIEAYEYSGEMRLYYYLEKLLMYGFIEPDALP